MYYVSGFDVNFTRQNYCQLKEHLVYGTSKMHEETGAKSNIQWCGHRMYKLRCRISYGCY